MNKKQVFNPYLPLYEYIPDGEPHVFDGRVYVYGSHDHFGAFDFCFNDYVTWSAPLDDLSDWRYEGVIFRKNQDPMNPKGKRCLFAPDVCGCMLDLCEKWVHADVELVGKYAKIKGFECFICTGQ